MEDPQLQSQLRHAGLLAVGFMILCAVVVVSALRPQWITAILQTTDQIPPRATFHFRTQGGRIFQGTITVQPGEPFVPFLEVRDNVDPSPTATVWLSPSAENLGQPVTLGNWMILEEPGTWLMHARVADASGNAITYSTLICAFNNPGSTTAERTDQKKTGTALTVRSSSMQAEFTLPETYSTHERRCGGSHRQHQIDTGCARRPFS